MLNNQSKLLLFLACLCCAMAPYAQSSAVFYNFETKKYSLEDLKTGKIISSEFDEMWLMDDGRYTVKRNERYGLMTNEGKIELECEYESLFKKDSYYQFQKKYKKGVFDKNLKIIIPANYSSIKIYDTFIAAAKHDSLGGFDFKGNLIIPFDYEASRITETSFFRFNKNKKAGVIDSLNNIMIPFEHTMIFKMSNRPADFEYMDDNEFMNNDMYAVYDDNASGGRKAGVYNSKGEIVLPMIYENVWPVYSNNLIGVRLDKKQGFVNLQNRIIIPCIYEEALPFNNGVSAVKLNGAYGAINDKNEFVIQPIYHEVLVFKKGLAKFMEYVDNKRKYGFINSKGKVMIPAQYDEAEYISTGYFRVKKDKGYGIVSLDGKEIIPPIYNGGIIVYDKTKFVVVKDKQWGVIDDKGKTLIPVEYDYVGNHGGIALVRKDKLNGAYSDKFELIIPLIYRNIRHFQGSSRITVLDQNNQSYNIDFSGKRTTVF